MSMPHHACAFVLRERPRRRELLVFRRDGELHVPCGLVAPDESASEAAHRALLDVAGLSDFGLVSMLHAELARGTSGAPFLRGSYAFECVDERPRWQHVVCADRPDHGALVDLFWAPLDDTLNLAGGLDDHLALLRG